MGATPSARLEEDLYARGHAGEVGDNRRRSPSHTVHILWFDYLLAMLVNMIAPTGLSSPRGYFNLDWITLIVMIVVFIVGLILFALSRGGKEIDAHLRDDAEKPAAVR
jgi:hypothetical protein